MKYLMYYLIVLILLTSCFDKKSDKIKFIAFDKIDVSIYDGETNYYALKIYNSRRIYICRNENGKPDMYYTFNIGVKELDSISFLINKISKKQIDTLYSDNCADCGFYRLMIKSRNIVIRSKVENINNSNDSINDMNELVSYLRHIVRISDSELKKNFKFETKTHEFYPTTPPPRFQ